MSIHSPCLFGRVAVLRRGCLESYIGQDIEGPHVLRNIKRPVWPDWNEYWQGAVKDGKIWGETADCEDWLSLEWGGVELEVCEHGQCTWRIQWFTHAYIMYHVIHLLKTHLCVHRAACLYQSGFWDIVLTVKIACSHLWLPPFSPHFSTFWLHYV